MNQSAVVKGSSAIDTIRKYRKHLVILLATVSLYALLGFFLAPWLVKKNAVAAVADNLHATLSIDNVAINPFVLSMRLQGIALESTSNDEIVNVDDLIVNLQLSSIFRWALTLREFHITGWETYLARDGSGSLNIGGLLRDTESTTDSEEPSAESAPVRLLIQDFAINDSVVHWDDQVPAEPVTAVFGPVNITIEDLNTLPQRPGQQDVVIVTDTQGTLGWSGSLQFNPLYTAGRATVTGSHFPLMSAYMRHATGLDIVEGTADVGLDYEVVTGDNGEISATVENFDLSFQDVLVRTFSGATGDDIEDLDLVRLPKIELTGGSLAWPEQTVAIESFSIDDASLSLFRDAEGELNFGASQTQAREPEAEREVSAEEFTDPDEASWQFSLQDFSVNRMAVGLRDESVDPIADIGITSLDLAVSDISNQPGVVFPTSLAIEPRTGGSINLQGTVTVLPNVVTSLALTIAELNLAAANPYLRSLIDVNLDSGALNLTAEIQSSEDNPFLLNGDFSVENFLITETDEGSRLGSWKMLKASGLAFNSAENALEFAEIAFEEPYADVLIAEDGSANLGRIQKESAGASSESTSELPENADSSDPFAISIGRVLVSSGAADFADLSLPLPFAANIADLNGDMSTIATTSVEPSTVEFEGTVDEFGLVRISGFVTPLDTSKHTDLQVAFENVEMPKFSAYTIPFAGREIDSGKLDLDLGYQVTDSELVGENKVVLRDLELGDEVPHPDAMSLPLGLAVALLKDPEGKIDIDLPVRGNVDDPEFQYGGVVLKALSTLVLKIVASPFALLGNLLGVEANELEYISFRAGRADLTPPEVERSTKLAEALALRPELVLELNGVIARATDGLAIRTAKLDNLIESRLDQSGQADGGVAEQQQSVIEALFVEMGGSNDPQAVMAQTRLEFTGATDGADTGEATETFDVLAYTAELRRQLIEAQTIEENELAALANERATNTQDSIVLANPALEARIILGGPQEVEDDEEDEVRMKVTLRTGSKEESAAVASRD